MNESELLDRVLDAHENSQASPTNTEIFIEEPYNHYGDRGVVDLYIQDTYNDSGRDTVIELKSDSALQDVTGANEVLRQYNRMARYFYEDDSHSFRRVLRKGERAIAFLLLFAPTPTTVEHVFNNRRVYQSATGSDKLGLLPVRRDIAFFTPNGPLSHAVSVDDVDTAGFDADVYRYPELKTAFDEADIEYELRSKEELDL